MDTFRSNDERLKDIFNLSFAAWEQVDKNPEEAKRLFKKIHSIASGGKYKMKRSYSRSFLYLQKDEHSPDCKWHKDWHACDCGKFDKPDEDILDDEEEALIDKLCDVVESELSSSYPYDRERTKHVFQKILDGEDGACQLSEQAKRYNLLQNDYLNSQNTVERMKDRILRLGGTYDDITAGGSDINELHPPGFYAQKDYYARAGKWPDEKCPTCGDPEFNCYCGED